MTKLPIIAFAAILTAGPAAAQNAPKPVPRAEYVRAIDGRFNAMDANHAGKVSKEELEAQRQRELQQAKAKIAGDLQNAFKRLDTNHDGKLTLEEFMASAPALRTAETTDQILQRLDSNHDGRISADEFRAPELAKFNRVDLNHDGIVTPQEIQATRGK